LFIRKENPCIVVGRDAQYFGEMVHRIITGTLIGMGCDVTDIGMATTPIYTEIAVEKKMLPEVTLLQPATTLNSECLKLLNSSGEFLMQPRERNFSPLPIGRFLIFSC
jgi:phosphomannomutase